MKALLCLLLASCSNGVAPPPGALCGSVPYGQPMLDCAVNALNEAMGCEQYAEDGPGVLSNGVTGSRVEVEFSEQEPGADDVGMTSVAATGVWRVQIAASSPWPWVVAGTLMHELGHTLAIRFVDNPSDEYHSLERDDIMFSGSDANINSETMKRFVAEVRASSSLSSKFACVAL